MDEPIRILLVEDNAGDARLLREYLREARSFPFELTHVDRLADACAKMKDAGADVVLLDLSLPDAHGMETVTGMLEAAPEVPIIVLTGLDDETTAVRAVHAGAQDYLVKGAVDSGVLVRAIRYARERKQLDRERAHLLERERNARATAENAVRARDEVLRVVAHDLGNSLSAMLVTTRVLLRTIPDEQAPARRHVNNIQALAGQMQRLRQDLLDVALLEAGQLSIQRGPLDPAAPVEESLDRYTPLAAEKSVRLTSRSTDGLPLIFADEARVLQVFANLLTNAIKFTPAGGTIAVGSDAAEGGVRFFVMDSGPGIPTEDLDHLFDRFWTTRNGNPHGAGLGLAIARGIVEAHGGSIQAESLLGDGSTFSFIIPAMQSSA